MFAPTSLPGLEKRIGNTFADRNVGIAHNDIKLCHQSLQHVLCSDHLNVFSHLTCSNVGGCLWVLSLFFLSPAVTSRQEVLALSEAIIE